MILFFHPGRASCVFVCGCCLLWSVTFPGRVVCPSYNPKKKFVMFVRGWEMIKHVDRYWFG